VIGRTAALPRRLRARSLPIAVAALVVAALTGSSTLAHGPNPLLGVTRWQQDQIIGYQWAPGGVPPAWAADEIEAAAEDVEQSRGSRAALFRRVANAESQIYYGFGVPCSSYGIACMNRTGVPDHFAGMWFRPHQWVLDWGQLRWCQAQTTFTNGCYDVENVALDEFGHIEILGHHVNYDDERDYLDSVVQFAARSRPRAGWNEHVFGRCDVARLQLEYELQTAATPVSTCLDLNTTLGIVASTTTVGYGDSTRFTGTLRLTTASAAKELAGDPLSARTITLQRRLVGATSWATAGTLAPNSTAGSYGLTISPTQTADYRLVFTAPSTEGVNSSTSIAVRIAVVTCSGTSGAKSSSRLVPMAPCA
jgi:hypothetical protein